MQITHHYDQNSFLADFVKEKPKPLKSRIHKIMIDASINLVAIFAIALVGFATMQTMMV